MLMFFQDGAPTPGCCPILVAPCDVAPQVEEGVVCEGTVKSGMGAADFIPEAEIFKGMMVVCV